MLLWNKNCKILENFGIFENKKSQLSSPLTNLGKYRSFRETRQRRIQYLPPFEYSIVPSSHLLSLYQLPIYLSPLAYSIVPLLHFVLSCLTSPMYTFPLLYSIFPNLDFQSFIQFPMNLFPFGYSIAPSPCFLSLTHEPINLEPSANS